MKKFLSAIVCIFAVAVVCLAGCSKDVSGSTYRYMGVNFDDTKFTKEDIAVYNEILSDYSAYTVDVEIVFGTDGTVKFGEKSGSYEQMGNTVKMYFGDTEETAVLGFKKMSITKLISGFSFGECEFIFDYESI